ncbi:Protein CBR-SRD-9 [Aphelenchoides besseyi]|nr:Protein CBR-SRD-9 [Aphelenchoides besseyi]
MSENVGINVTTVNNTSKQLLQINYYCAFALGSVFNAVLIFLILRRSPTNLQSYRPILLIAAFTDCFSILIVGLCQKDVRQFDRLSLAVFNGPAKYLPEIWQHVAYALLLISFNLEALILLLETWFRYQFVKTRNVMPLKRLLCFVLVILILCSIQVPIFVSDYVYYRNADNEYRLLWRQEDLNAYVMIVHFKIHWVYHLNGMTRLLISTAALLLSIFISFWSIHVMKKDVTNISKKTRDLLDQFTRTIVIRLIMFSTTSVLPVGIAIIAKYLVINWIKVNLIALLFFPWLPGFNSALSIYFIKPYRETLLELNRRLFAFCSSTNETRVQSVS